MADIDVNRLLLQFEKSVREINREEINPLIPALTLKDLNPIVRMVARSRAEYLKELFDLSSLSNNQPLPEQIARLKRHRESYEELVTASKALEVALERDYLDVEH